MEEGARSATTPTTASSWSSVRSLAEPGAFAVVVSSGTGQQRLAGEPQSFAAPCTLVVPERVEHEVANTGSVTMQLLALEPGPQGMARP